MQPRPAVSSESKPKLLDQVRHVLRLKHMSYRTEEAYVQWMKRFIVFHHKRHPSTMGAAEIRAFLTHLAVDRKVAASTHNVALQARLFSIVRSSNSPSRRWRTLNVPKPQGVYRSC